MGINNLKMAGTGKKYIFKGALTQEELDLVANNFL
jgi:hypothetical protein